jgi:hypothetical protein
MSSWTTVASGSIRDLSNQALQVRAVLMALVKIDGTNSPDYADRCQALADVFVEMKARGLDR